MNLPRICTGAVASMFVFAIWLGACGQDETVTCGDGGDQLGTCYQGDKCPSGTGSINATDPSDACPATYICCAAIDGGAAILPVADAGTPPG